MRKHLCTKETGKKGFTLVEMMTVVAVIAILCAIGIPSTIAIKRNLQLKQHNDYAKSIFMAAQANVTEKQSDGGLSPLLTMTEADGACAIPKDKYGFPKKDFKEGEYYFTYTGTKAYDFILPPGSIDSAVRDENVIIEYNPKTGNIYSVFYTENDSMNGPAMQARYKATPPLPRNKDEQKALRDSESLVVGYYQGSAVISTEATKAIPDTEILFDGMGQEAEVTVRVVIPSKVAATNFRTQLQADLTISGGEITKAAKAAQKGVGVDALNLEDYSFTIRMKEAGSAQGTGLIKGMKIKDAVRNEDGKHCLWFTFPLDSLLDQCSFANRVYITEETGEAGSKIVKTDGSSKYISELTDASMFRILPGDNVTLEVHSVYVNLDGNPAVKIKPGFHAEINPLFEYLIPSAFNDPAAADAEGKYVLGVSNGRHLQNLNLVHPEVAKYICDIMIGDDIDWAETSRYYNNKYGVKPADNPKAPKVYSNKSNGNKNELPGRCLPYFVPLQNDALFGTVTPGVENAKAYPEIHGRDRDNNGVIAPNGNNGAAEKPEDQRPDVIISNLNIKRGLYQSYTKIYSATPASCEGVGMFSYLNAPVDHISIVNPLVNAEGSKAAGVLAGFVGNNAKVLDCRTYLNVDAPNFGARNEYGDTGINAYGICKGNGAVGGLVGYAQSSSTVPVKETTKAGVKIYENLTDDVQYLTFLRSFAAVPVHGNMNADGKTSDAYEGIGGFVGYSYLANAYDCYASGDVSTNRTSITWRNPDTKVHGSVSEEGAVEDLLKQYHPDVTLKEFEKDMPLGYDGRYSVGAGGFVGTSRGTRYTNCFATGDARTVDYAVNNKTVQKKTYEDAAGYENYAEQSRGVGSFVGVMSYDAQKIAGNDAIGIDQWTIFEDCYAIGRAYARDEALVVFSGANARRNITADTLVWQNGAKAGYVGDYHRVLAPYLLANPGKELLPTENIWYIFKNTYQYDYDQVGHDNNSSNECANFISYDELDILTTLHNDYPNGKEWRNKRVADIIKKYPLNPVGKKTPTYDSVYFSKQTPAMENAYKESLKTFSMKHWHDDVTQAMTHPYDTSLTGAYPFAKLMGIDYYGDWPLRPLGSGLAYYEIYGNDSEKHPDRDYDEPSEKYGIFFDRDGAANCALKNRGDRNAEGNPITSPVVKRDGYIMLSQERKQTIKIKVSNADTVIYEEELTVQENPYVPGGSFGPKTFWVYDLHVDKIIQALDDKNLPNEEFYSKLVVDGDEKNAYYFNPRVALSHVNPDGKNILTKPGSTGSDMPAVPPRILIRSARHFSEIGKMDGFWGEGCNYFQQLNVNGLWYEWTNENIRGRNYFTQPIGSATNQFNGTYTSHQATIKGLLPGNGSSDDVGLFGYVGNTGRITNLNVKVIPEKESGGVLTIGTTARANAGIVVGSCEGFMKDVRLYLSPSKESAEIMYASLYGDSDDGPYENWWDWRTDDDDYDDPDRPDDTPEWGDNVNSFSDKRIKAIKDKIQEGLDAVKKAGLATDEDWEEFKEEFGERKNWGHEKDDGKWENKYDDDAFEDIFKWIDEHLAAGEGEENYEDDDDEYDAYTGPASIRVVGSANAGALVGKALNTSIIWDCDVLSGLDASLELTADNSGAFAGSADGSNIQNGHVEISKNFNLNKGNFGGGFVGFARNTSFGNCITEIGRYANNSGMVSKEVVTGGFAGHISNAEDPDGVRNTTVDGCHVALQCTVDAITFGGFAGEAENVRITGFVNYPVAAITRDVHATDAAGLIQDAVDVDTRVTAVEISAKFEGKNSAAGMFGIVDQKSTVDGAVVSLPRGASITSASGSAAGFAVDTSANIKDARVLLSEFNETEDTKLTGKKPNQKRVFIEPAPAISGSKDAAGFACAVNAGTIEESSVSGRGMIQASANASGFANQVASNVSVIKSFVTPVRQQLNKDGSEPQYLGDGLPNLVVKGSAQAAGFTNAMAAESKTTNSYTLCLLQNETQNAVNNAGFANSNAGMISGCMANIELAAQNDGNVYGHVFAVNEGGKVENCYGWYTDNCNTNDIDGVVVNRQIPGVNSVPSTGYVSCYFADIDYVAKKDDQELADYEKVINVTRIDKDSKVETCGSTKLLLGPASVDALNMAGNAQWDLGGSWLKFPFSKYLANKSYAYPMLRDHYGDWREPPFPSFGVVYYEVFNTKPIKLAEGQKWDESMYDPAYNVYWLHIRDTVANDAESIDLNGWDFMGYFDANGNLLAAGYGKPVMTGEGAATKIVAQEYDPIAHKYKPGEVELSKIPGMENSGITTKVDIYKADYCLFQKRITEEGDIDFVEPPTGQTKAKYVVKRTDPRMPGDPLCVRTPDLMHIQMKSTGLTSEDYFFYEMDDTLKGQGKITITGKGKHAGSININTFFGDAMPDKGDKNYEIRSADQFKHIADYPDSTLNQTWDILNNYGRNDDFITVEKFTGHYQGNHRKVVVDNASSTWLGDVAAHSKIEGTNIEITHDMSAPLMDAVNGSLHGSGPEHDTPMHMDSIIVKGDVKQSQSNVPGALFRDVSRNMTCKELRIEGDAFGCLIGSISTASTLPAITIEGNLNGYFIPGHEHEGYVTGAFIGSVNHTFTCDGLTIGSLQKDENGNYIKDKNGNHIVKPGTGNFDAYFAITNNTTMTIKTINIRGDFGKKPSSGACGIFMIGAGKLICDDFYISGALNQPWADGPQKDLVIVNNPPVHIGQVLAPLYTNVKNAKMALPAVETYFMNAPLVDQVTDSTITGGVINLNGGDMNAPVIGSAVNSTVDGIKVENGIQKAAIVDKAAQSIVKNCEANLNSAEIGAGQQSLMVNEATGSAIENCSVNVPAVQVSNDAAFGMIAGTSDKDSIVSDCSVGTSKATAVTAKAGQFGGIVGENQGEVKGNTVENVEMTLRGSADQATAAGAVMGVNSGSVSENKVVNAKITYTQSAVNNDTAEIGGLVGRNEGGSVKDSNEVSGEIILAKPSMSSEVENQSAGVIADSNANGASGHKYNGSVTVDHYNGTEGENNTAADAATTPNEIEGPNGRGRNYRVGGIIGTEIESGKAVYENVVSSVLIDPNFADPKTASTVNDPAGQGSVGMFVGYVTDGTFKNCSSVVKANTKYDFLGEILTDVVTADETMLVSKDKNTSQTVKGELNSLAYGFVSAEGKSFSQYSAVLEGCSFNKGGVNYKQVIEKGDHFFTQTGAVEIIHYKGADVAAKVKAMDKLALIDLASQATSGEYGFTPYFALVNGEYLPLYVKLTVSGGSAAEAVPAAEDATDAATEPATEPETTPVTYAYELAYYQNGAFHAYGSAETENPDSTVWQNKEFKIYSVDAALEDGIYLILNDQDQMLTLGEDFTDVSWQPVAPMDKVENRMTWTSYRNSDNKISWLNTADSTCFLGRDLKAVSDEQFLGLRAFADGSFRLGDSGMKIILKKLTVVESSKPEFSNTFNYCGTDQSIGAVDSSGNKTGHVKDESVKPTEEVKPAETTAPTESVKPTETTAPTEAAKPAETTAPSEAAKPAVTSKAEQSNPAQQNVPTETVEDTQEGPVVDDGASPQVAA